MKKHNRIIAGVMALSIAFVGGAIIGQGYNISPALMTANAVEKYGDLTYVVNDDNTITITGCNTTATEVDIPSKINGIPVTIIGERAFALCKNLTSITIPNSVVSFDEFAFNSSGLTSIEIPNSVTSIGLNVFAGCSNLVSITIPDNITNIYAGAFFGCTNLKEITILNPKCEIYDNGTTISNIVNTPLDCYFYGTIYGYENSTAQAYAEEYGYNFSLIDAVATTTTTTTTTTPPVTTKPQLLGDVNDDGFIDSVDATLIMSYYAYISATGTDLFPEYLDKMLEK